MTPKHDTWIRRMAQKGMIEPFVERSEYGVLSYGLSSFGYDIRCAQEFKLCTHMETIELEIDPKGLDPRVFREDLVVHNTRHGRCVMLPPHSFALTRSLEYFEIPRNVVCLVLGKSTYARCGIFLNATPLEPEWKGHITLEVYNSTSLPARIYTEEGIGQILFFAGDSPEVSYADKRGKYQYQTGITLPRVDWEVR